MRGADNRSLGTLSLALTFSRIGSETIDASIDASFTGANATSMSFRTVGSVMIFGRISEPPTLCPGTATDYNLANDESTTIYNHTFNVSGARDLEIAAGVMLDVLGINVSSKDGN